MKFIILYDNYTLKKPFKSGWGFSAYFPEIGLLFDTGEAVAPLRFNLEQAGFSLSDVRYLVLSHEHWDHIGGVELFGKGIKLFAPQSFSSSFVVRIKNLGMEFVPISSPQKIVDNFYTTGEMGNEVIEQSLIVMGKKANVFTGCSHPGIVNIVKKAKELHNEIGMVVGGFHLLHKSKSEIEDIAKEIKNMGVDKILPTHCTGDMAKGIFKDMFGDRYYECGAGYEGQIV